MEDQQDKHRQLARYQRGLKHFVGYEEQKRRKADARHRESSRSDHKARRRHDWSSEDDEDFENPTFEKIRRRRHDQKRASAGFHAGESELPSATVAAIHRGRVQLAPSTEGDAELRDARISHSLAVDPDLRLAVGDQVLITETDGPPRVEAILERRTRLARPDPGNPNLELVLAANVDLGVVVVAAQNPPLRPGLIDRFFLGLSRGGIQPIVCVNKIDLVAEGDRDSLEAMVSPYRELEVPVVLCSASTGEGLDELRRHLAGATCVFVGHSGVGKSSILNAIDPQGDRSTGDVRDHDGKGRHITTSSSLRKLPDGTQVIDTPGIRSFGLDRWTPEQVRDGFAEFEPHASRCRYGDCTHLQEPDCAVRAAVEEGELPEARYQSYARILASL